MWKSERSAVSSIAWLDLLFANPRIVYPPLVRLRVRQASPSDWGLQMIACTGSKAHLKKLAAVSGGLRSLQSSGRRFATEHVLYRSAGLEYMGVDPEVVSKRVDSVMGLPAILSLTAGAETTLFI